MINSEMLKKVRNLISEGELKTAFDIMLNEVDLSEEYHDTLISLKRQYALTNDEVAKGKLSLEEQKIGLNKIYSNFLRILREIEDKSIKVIEDPITLRSDEDYEDLILESVAKGDINKAINLFKKWLEEGELEDTRFFDQLFILLYRYNDLRNKELRGTLSSDVLQLELSKISRSIVDLVRAVKNEPKKLIERKEKQEQIETSAASFVQESISELTKREQILKRQAIFWYLLGFLALISGIIITVVFIKGNLDGDVTTISLIFQILKSILIIALLVAASRYSFNLGKTYMNESLKNADRIHAISFGKFYLQVFGTNIKPEDLKDVFKDWNMNQESPFIKLDSSEFDPQLLQAVLKFIETVKGVK